MQTPKLPAPATFASSAEAQARLLDAILDASEDLIYVIAPDGRYLYVSAAAERVAGLPRTAMIGRTAAEIGLRTDLAARLAGERAQVLATGARMSGELRIADAAGDGRVYLYTYSPLSLAPDAVEAIICIARDVTEQRRTEAEAAAATARLNAAYLRDHDIAATLQRSLLQMPLSDAFPGLEVVSRYESGTADMEIGGDFLDAFLLDRSRVALAVGDVTGKGLPAAARIAEAKFTLRAFLREYPSCPIGLKRLNAYLCDTPLWEGQPGEGFVCLSLAILDTENGVLTVATAGAETPLLARADGRTEALATHGMVLGVMPDMDYGSAAAQMGAGDTLLLMTDGIAEARREDSQFGLEGLRRVVTQAGPDVSPADLAERVMAEARAFAGGTLRDDACLLLARRVS
ncbi:MAG: SpoIIE family protein phosphatase [Armatimonadetes bacterium]|nr:SpoIIE family protein phosphatase [Armatimonadota bacterium]